MKNVLKLIIQLLIQLMNKMFSSKREFYSLQYLKGKGLEIGALTLPLLTSPCVRVKYVDKFSIDVLRKHYPKLKNYNMVIPDIIENGEELNSIESESQDFIIANHFLEHCQNPILTIKNMLRVLKRKGILYLTVPDKEKSFDKMREVTLFDHFIEDFERGSSLSKREHYVDFVKNVYSITDDKIIQQTANELIQNDFSIHFHVWDSNSIIMFLWKVNLILENSYSLELFTRNDLEFLIIIKKQ